MSPIKRLLAGAGILKSGFLASTLVTIYTATINNDLSVQTNQGCIGLSYITSGFPVRDIYIREYKGGECGSVYIEMGHTGIGEIPLLINWLFWSGLVFLIPPVIRKYRRP
jgi:hypothetical protein